MKLLENEKKFIKDKIYLIIHFFLIINVQCGDVEKLNLQYLWLRIILSLIFLLILFTNSRIFVDVITYN